MLETFQGAASEDSCNVTVIKINFYPSWFNGYFVSLHELKKKGKEAHMETHLNSVPYELAWDCSNLGTYIYIYFLFVCLFCLIIFYIYI